MLQDKAKEVQGPSKIKGGRAACGLPSCSCAGSPACSNGCTGAAYRCVPFWERDGVWSCTRKSWGSPTYGAQRCARQWRATRWSDWDHSRKAKTTRKVSIHKTPLPPPPPPSPSTSLIRILPHHITVAWGAQSSALVHQLCRITRYGLPFFSTALIAAIY